MELARALFEPEAVALIGASGDAGKNTARPQRYLTRLGFRGHVYPINPARATVADLPAYPTVSAAPGPVDHAFIMVPARAVPAALEDCAAAGVPLVTVYSDGFAEAGGDGHGRQRELVALARHCGVRLVGPNCMGIVNLHAGLALTVSATFEEEGVQVGGVSVISQSGGMLGALLSRGAARGAGFSKLVSIGNEADVSVAEVIEILVADPHTDVVVLFLETIRSPAALAVAARRAFAAGKPIVAYLVGRSTVGQALAVSHSAALAGAARAAECFLDTHGIVRVEMLDTLVEIPALLKGRRPVGGRRVAVITTTGGGAATVADRLGLLDVTLVPAPPSVVAAMAREGIDVTRAPIVDLTMAGARPAVYGRALELLLSDADCEAVVAVAGSSAQHRPELAVQPIVEQAGRAAAGKALVAFAVPHAERSLAMLAAAGVAAFRTPEACADALHAYLSWRAPRPLAQAVLPDRALRLLDAAVRAPAGAALDEAAGLALFEALGVPVVAHAVLAHAAVAHTIPYPLAAKLLSPDLPHKSSVGAVRLGIEDATALAAAEQAMRTAVASGAPGARIGGLLVQRMTAGLGEAIVGLRRDPAAGPIVTVGVGGILTEIYADSAVAMAPVDLDGAREAIARVKGFAPLRGFRNLPRGDLEALARVVVLVSNLALDERLREAELNPVMVLPEGQGVVAVDALVVVHGGMDRA